MKESDIKAMEEIDVKQYLLMMNISNDRLTIGDQCEKLMKADIV